MVEDILKKDGLSFALLRKLSFRTRLEENLDQPISGLDEETLTEELKNIVAWYDSSDILAGLPIDYRIKSLQAILRKYQRASGESRVERVFNDILGFRTLCDNYEDRITHDIRRSNWLEILNRSQQRPVHTTIKQWCLDNGISEKSYYYWQRKFRQEAAGQVSVPSATDSVPVTFAEIPFAYRDKPSGSAPTDTVAAVQPTAVFKYKDLTVAVTNEISDTLLSRIIREVTHA